MTATVANGVRKPIPKSKRPLPKSQRMGLRPKPEGKSAWDRLPFVGKDHSKHFSSWDVPLTGGFFGGIEAGRVAARLFIKYLRDERDNPSRLGAVHLRGVLSALDAKQVTTEEEQHSLNGHRTGFMNEIFDWLDAAALTLGSSFDAISQRSLVQQANEHLTRTDAALMSAINSRSAK
jgi:hypothetical protein